VGKGLRTYSSEVYVELIANGQRMSNALPVDVTLTSSDPGCALAGDVSHKVIVPAGQGYAYFQVAGMGLGACRVIPSATGYLAAQELDVSVIKPILRFNGLSTALNVGSTDDFTVSIEAPGATYSQSQTAIEPIGIALTSAVPNVATVTSTITIPANQYGSDNARVTATGVGSTTVTASGATVGSDITPLTSPIITVNP